MPFHAIYLVLMNVERWMCNSMWHPVVKSTKSQDIKKSVRHKSRAEIQCPLKASTELWKFLLRTRASAWRRLINWEKRRLACAHPAGKIWWGHLRAFAMTILRRTSANNAAWHQADNDHQKQTTSPFWSKCPAPSMRWQVIGQQSKHPYPHAAPSPSQGRFSSHQLLSTWRGWRWLKLTIIVG